MSARRSAFVRAALLPLLAVSVCFWSSCVKIEKGSPDEAAAHADMQASNLRTEWANRILDAEPLEVGQLLIAHAEAVSRSYAEYGHQVALEWEEGETQSGRTIPGSEMRTVIAGWNESNRPVLQANEDNLEYAYAVARDARYFDDAAMSALKNVVDAYYTVYNAVFLPSSDRTAYADEVWQAERGARRAVDEARQELSRY